MLETDYFDRVGTMTYRLVSESILELHAINSGPVLVCVRLRRICLGARSGVRHAHCHLHIGRRRSDISLGSLLEEHGWLLLLGGSMDRPEGLDQ